MKGSKPASEQARTSFRRADHLHDEVRLRVIEQRQGVPHEIRRTVCRHCGTLLSEEPIGRAAG